MEHLEIIKVLKKNNFEAYLVGGCVRDSVMGLDPDDFDITTNAHPEQIQKLFKNQNVKSVGKSFGVIIVDDIEIATFRFDRYTNNGECVVHFAETLLEDLSRRDLTINSMAFNGSTGELIDPFYGKKDLENRVIKFVGDAQERINEDPCRILRACRFIAKINGIFALNTFNALNWSVIEYGKIDEIAPERIRSEIMKAMKLPNASLFFEALHSIGALERIFPALASCWNHEHGHHHTENVFEHCMLAGDAVSTRFPLIKLAAYLHDCGKPESFNPETKQFLEHEKHGSASVSDELFQLKFSKDEIKKVSGLIRCHMFSIDKMKSKGIRRFRKRLFDNGINITEFFRIRMADRRANLARDPFSITEWKKMILKVTAPDVITPKKVTQLVISGGDIIKELNLVPGPIVGEIHKHILEFVIDNGPSVNDRETLLTIARTFMGEK